MKIVVAITGATGAVYGIRLLEALKQAGVETHLVVSDWGKRTIELETTYSFEDVRALADYFYDDTDMAAAISSGSFKHDGMVVMPCSMKTLSAISHGYAEKLITRSADVCLKEHRKLILSVRETPLSPIDLANMLELSKIGVSIVPPMPAFYNQPKTIDDIVFHHISRVMDLLGIENSISPRWTGDSK